VTADALAVIDHERKCRHEATTFFFEQRPWGVAQPGYLIVKTRSNSTLTCYTLPFGELPPKEPFQDASSGRVYSAFKAGGPGMI
jgi:hypothetical protein